MGLGWAGLGWSAGPLALRAYLADVRDPAKTFEETAEWFCCATIERLMAARCAEVWLRCVGEELSARRER
jgi:hypothetical protein